MNRETLSCPYCLVAFHDDHKVSSMGQEVSVDGDLLVQALSQNCPSCKRLIVQFLIYDTSSGMQWYEIDKRFVYPKASARKAVPVEVPAHYAQDYIEACLVLSDSPQASAALTRRLLQCLLHDEAKIKEKNLDQEIQKFITSQNVPSHIAEVVDAVRVNGNFAAHPIKSQSTGEIAKVEPHEAEWNLDVIEELFDFFFVGPARIQSKKDQLNKKLLDSGKPLLK